jgi:hypothetical protein
MLYCRTVGEGVIYKTVKDGGGVFSKGFCKFGALLSHYFFCLCNFLLKTTEILGSIIKKRGSL